MNMLPYRSGKILYDGQDVTQCSTHELAQRGIAMMHQGGVVFPNLSVWQNLQMAMGNSQRSTINSQLQDIIPLLQQPKKKLMRTMADKLSGGQRHDLALAMTLARKPKLVILDEPSAGLSPKAVEEMYGMLVTVRKTIGITIVLIEQNLTHAVEFCDKCEMLGTGILIYEFIKNENSIFEIEKVMFNN
jgi:ABC-type branched-subunit amino acid transport system ATPase component